MATNIHFSYRLFPLLDNFSSTNPLEEKKLALSEEAVDFSSKDSENSCLDNILKDNLGFSIEALKQLPVPMWRGEELSYEEVINCFATNPLDNQEKPPLPKDLFFKRGRWSKKDLKRLSTHVKEFHQSASKAQNVWESVSLILKRHPESCEARYYKLLEKEKIASQLHNSS